MCVWPRLPSQLLYSSHDRNAVIVLAGVEATKMLVQNPSRFRSAVRTGEVLGLPEVFQDKEPAHWPQAAGTPPPVQEPGGLQGGGECPVVKYRISWTISHTYSPGNTVTSSLMSHVPVVLTVQRNTAWLLWPLCLQPPMGEEGGRRKCHSSSAGDEGRRRRHPSNSTSKPTQPSKSSSSAPKDNAQKTAAAAAAAQGKKNESAAGGKKESVKKWSPRSGLWGVREETWSRSRSAFGSRSDEGLGTGWLN